MLASPVHATGESYDTLIHIKVAYILNFMKFTEWPSAAFPSDDSPLVIAWIGDRAFAADLEALLETARVNDRAVVMRAIVVADGNREEDYTKYSLERIKNEIAGSHAVFIGDSMRRDAKRLIENALPANVLSIGDHQEFAESGAMLALSRQDNRVLFYANPKAIEGSEVRVSSKVLRLAKLVRD